VWRCLVVPGSHSVKHGAAVPVMEAQRRVWRHRAGGDEGDALHWSDVMAPSRAGLGLTSVPLSRVPPSSLEGCDMEAVQEWVAQCHRDDTDLPHSSRTVPGMASQGGFVEQRRDTIPRRCQRAGVAGIHLFTQASAACQSI
jgi:hypothetical protein